MSAGYLVDTSVWNRFQHPVVQLRLSDPSVGIYTCTVVCVGGWALGA